MNTMVPSRTLILQDPVAAVNSVVSVNTSVLQDPVRGRRQDVNSIVPVSILTSPGRLFGTRSSSADKHGKSLKFASVIATYWDG